MLSQAKVRDGQQIQSRVRALDTQYKSLVSLSSSRFASVFSFSAGVKDHLSSSRPEHLSLLSRSVTTALTFAHLVYFLLFCQEEAVGGSAEVV